MTLGSLKERLWSIAEWEATHVWREGYPAWVLAGDQEQLKRKVPPPLKLKKAQSRTKRFFLGALTFVAALVGSVIGKDVARNVGNDISHAIAPSAAQQIEDALKQAVILSRTKFPIKLDDATTIIELSSVGTKMTYRLVTTIYDADFAAVKMNIAKTVCPSYLNKLLQGGATIEYRYERKEDQVYVGRVTMTKQDCGPYNGN